MVAGLVRRFWFGHHRNRDTQKPGWTEARGLICKQFVRDDCGKSVLILGDIKTAVYVREESQFTATHYSKRKILKRV